MWRRTTKQRMRSKWVGVGADGRRATGDGPRCVDGRGIFRLAVIYVEMYEPRTDEVTPAAHIRIFLKMLACGAGAKSTPQSLPICLARE